MMHMAAAKLAVWTSMICLFLFPGFFPAEAELDAGPAPIVSYSRQQPSSVMPVIRWKADLDAVSYELEVFGKKPAFVFPGQLSEQHVYEDGRIYTNAVMLDLDQIVPGHDWSQPVYWRVRAMNLDRQPITEFSSLTALYGSEEQPARHAPVPRASFDEGNGTVLLYPVYSFIPMPDAAQYEVEVTDEIPENPDGTEPSAHRIFSRVISNANLYDPEARIGTYYWRVRGLDAEGRPVGIWSRAEKFRTDPDDQWEIGVFGDSISHGGGNLSYGPADWTYSYSHYLNFPVINLSFSGDTSASAVERFDRDVLPFHVKYLLIMTGSNSIRADVPPEDVIHDLQTLQEKCRDHGIIPILMTLPPLNPSNIRKAFSEDTYGDWQAHLAAVNEFIRTQPHIDTAAAFADYSELPYDLAADGLHGNWRAKQMMARVINEHIGEFVTDLPL